MEKLKRDYYPVEKAAEIFGYEVDDLLHFAERGSLVLSVRASLWPIECEGIGMSSDENGDIVKKNKVAVVDASGLFDLPSFEAQRVEENRLGTSIFSLSTNEFSNVGIIDEGEEKDALGKKFRKYYDKVIFDLPHLSKEEKELPFFPQNQHTPLFVEAKQVFVRTKEMESLSKKEMFVDETSSFKESLPKELACAFSVYEEFWEDRPEDTNPAPEKVINSFIKEKVGNISSSALERIRTIARPENERKGGAHNTEKRAYKGKSKENL